MLPINCERCHKVFQPTANQKECPTCKQADELDFRRIKDYLYDHPGATASEVATVLNVSMRVIKFYLKEERLEIIGKNNNFLECENCAKPIPTGHYCPACLQEFHNKTLAMNSEAAANYKRMNPEKFPDEWSLRFVTKSKKR